MHVRRLRIRNIRSIREFDLDLREDGDPAGWHVLIGDNGAGKSTVVRALALALMGEKNAHATREDWGRWLADGRKSGAIDVVLRGHDADKWTGSGRLSNEDIAARVDIEAEGSKRNGRRARIAFSDERYAERTVWGAGEGWFSASFGAFRRFSGAAPEMNRLFLTHPGLAPHLSAFGENVALGESLRWLTNLEIRKLGKDCEAEKIQEAVISFVNGVGLLPHGAHIGGVTPERVIIVDGPGSTVSVEEMSDGYRSMLSLTFELMRLMFENLGADKALAAIDSRAGTVRLPGAVAIDEIDAHLHPAWQKRIGDWFVTHFPETQFFVTTHSPIVCRAAARGSVWQLPSPGEGGEPRRVAGHDLDRLIDGNILDAYGTELFGEDVTRSERSREKLERLARLNRKRLHASLSHDERKELERLRAMMPSSPNRTAAAAD